MNLDYIEDPKSHIGKMCHIQGVNRGCVWVLKETDGVMHTLETPKTKRTRYTTKRLTYTNSQMIKLKSKESKS